MLCLSLPPRVYRRLGSYSRPLSIRNVDVRFQLLFENRNLPGLSLIVPRRIRPHSVDRPLQFVSTDPLSMARNRG